MAIQIRAPKLYESTALVTAQRHSAISAVGQAGTELPSADDMDRVIATEIEMSHSDPVLRPVAERYGIEVVGPPPRAR